MQRSLVRLHLFNQANLITEYATVVQPVQVAFQQQIQNLKSQHEEFVSSLTQQQQQIQIPPLENEVKSTPPPQTPAAAPASAPPSVPVTQAGTELNWCLCKNQWVTMLWLLFFPPFLIVRYKCTAGLVEAKAWICSEPCSRCRLMLEY